MAPSDGHDTLDPEPKLATEEFVACGKDDVASTGLMQAVGVVEVEAILGS
jgi:hypothetical protein